MRWIVIRNIIREKLIEEDYNFANIGTIYILDAIEIICKSKEYMKLLKNLEQNVYVQIAKKYNKNEKTLKSDIIKATNRMNDIKYLKNMNENKNKTINIKKTPKMIISDIVDAIKNGDNSCVKY